MLDYLAKYLFSKIKIDTTEPTLQTKPLQENTLSLQFVKGWLNFFL